MDKEEQSLYRWSFSEQKKANEEEKAKRKNRGIGIYSVVMVSAFGLCFLALIGALVWYSAFGSVDARSKSVSEIAASVKPATVLLAAETDSGYDYYTGMMFRSDGYLLTSTSVLSGATNVQAQVYGSDLWFDTVVVGVSEADGIAVLRLPAGAFGATFPYVTFGDSDTVESGDTAVLISNLCGEGAPWSVTEGVFSSTERTFLSQSDSFITEYRFFQIDAEMTSESAGGPVCNELGEIVGMAVGQLYGTEGVGLVFPINGVRLALSGILGETNYDPSTDSLLQRSRPLLGISCLEVTASDFDENAKLRADGLLVSAVNKGSPAYGKLYTGDVIVSCNGTETPTMDDFTEILYGCKSGDTVSLEVIRSDEMINVSVTFQ